MSDTKVDELKPEDMARDNCPWCKSMGRYPHKIYVKDHNNINMQHKKYACWCSKCGCEGPLANTEVIAIILWNEQGEKK